MKKKSVRIIIFLALLALTFWIGTRWERFWNDLEEIGEPIYNMERVYFPNKKNTLFIKSKSWGLLGNHTVTVISNNPDLEFHPDSTSEYIIHGSDCLFYQKQHDTLIVYHNHKLQVPDNFASNINVRVVELKVYEWQEMRDKINNSLRRFN